MLAVILSFSVLMTIELLISAGKKGAMMEASKRVMETLEGNTACSRASLSIASQNSSTCTSSEAWNSGHVNFRERGKKNPCGLVKCFFTTFIFQGYNGARQHVLLPPRFWAGGRCLYCVVRSPVWERSHKFHRSCHWNHAPSDTQMPSIHCTTTPAHESVHLDSTHNLRRGF